MKTLSVCSLALSLMLLTLAPTTLLGQENEALEKTRAEIKATFGTMPSFFAVFPENALPGAWEAFKGLTGPNAAIPPKYQELIGLSVAAQIPCDYCVYYHTEVAKANGASEAEIHEAVALGANVRHWSMILQGNQIDLEDFKKQFQEMMAYMAEQASKN